MVQSISLGNHQSYRRNLRLCKFNGKFYSNSLINAQLSFQRDDKFYWSVNSAVSFNMYSGKVFVREIELLKYGVAYLLILECVIYNNDQNELKLT